MIRAEGGRAMPRAVPTSSRVREIYDRLAPRYDRCEGWVEWWLRRYRKRLLARARGRVLEVGIGTGRNLPYYPAGCRITGIDLSPEMLKVAARRAARLGRDVTLLPMDAEELSFPSGSFDTVVSTLTLCTVVDPIRALGEMARVTAPGGRILLLEHGRSTHLWLSRLLDRLAPHQIAKCGCHPNRNVLALVQAADLVVLRCERCFLGVLHLIWARPKHLAVPL